MVYKFELDNGLQIVIDQDLNAKTCTIQYEVAAGSLDETGSYSSENNFGCAHFVEHMLFKGTEKRNVQQLNIDVASIGAYVNAYTTSSQTAFFISSPSDVWKEAFEILNDYFWNSTLPEEEFNKEKTVILEELKMYEDDPAEKCVNQLRIGTNRNYENRQHIAGTVESVKKLTLDDLKRFRKCFYHPNNALLVAAGNIPVDEFVAEASFYTQNLEQGLIPKRDMLFTDFVMNNEISKIVRKDISQANFAVTIKGVPPYDPRYFVQKMLSKYLGGGATSILYDIIREKNGFAYTVSSYLSTTRDSSFIRIFTGLDSNNVDKVHSIIVKELNRTKSFIDEEKVDILKAVYKGELLLSLETTESKISLPEDNFINGTDYTLEDIMNRIKNVTIDEMKSFAKEFFKPSNIYWSLVSPSSKA